MSLFSVQHPVAYGALILAGVLVALPARAASVTVQLSGAGTAAYSKAVLVSKVDGSTRKLDEFTGDRTTVELDPGKYKIGIRWLGYVYWSDEFSVTSDRAIEIQAETRVVEIIARTTLNGKASPAPLGDLSLQMPDGAELPLQAQTDARGSALLRLPLHPYKLTFRYQGHRIAELVRETADRHSFTVPMRELRCIAVAGQTTIDAYLGIVSPHYPQPITQGWALVGHPMTVVVPAGPYKVESYIWGKASGVQTFDFGADGSGVCEARTDAIAVDLDIRYLTGSPQATDIFDVTDPSGRVVFRRNLAEGTPPQIFGVAGRWKARIVRQGREIASLPFVLPGTAKLSLVDGTRVVTVSVRDAMGTPLSAASVTAAVLGAARAQTSATDLEGNAHFTLDPVTAEVAVSWFGAAARVQIQPRETSASLTLAAFEAALEMYPEPETETIIRVSRNGESVSRYASADGALHLSLPAGQYTATIEQGSYAGETTLWSVSRSAPPTRWVLDDVIVVDYADVADSSPLNDAYTLGYDLNGQWIPLASQKLELKDITGQIHRVETDENAETFAPISFYPMEARLPGVSSLAVVRVDRETRRLSLMLGTIRVVGVEPLSYVQIVRADTREPIIRVRADKYGQTEALIPPTHVRIVNASVPEAVDRVFRMRRGSAIVADLQPQPGTTEPAPKSRPLP